MRLRVIEGGLGVTGDERENGRADRNAVRCEAARRLSVMGYPRLRGHELITGVPMPTALKHLAIQIEFAAKAIARLNPIPADFSSDLYWPGIEAITTE